MALSGLSSVVTSKYRNLVGDYGIYPLRDGWQEIDHH